MPYAEIEVEYYNEDGKIKPPADPYIIQVIKADKNVFTTTKNNKVKNFLKRGVRNESNDTGESILSRK